MHENEKHYNTLWKHVKEFYFVKDEGGRQREKINRKVKDRKNIDCLFLVSTKWQFVLNSFGIN